MANKWDILDEDDRSYIAGYLDGEGCFTVGKNWKITVACENTHRATIKWLHKVFGGSFSSLIRKKKPEWRPTYRWSVVCKDALRVCQLLCVYLHEKQEQAGLLVALQQTMNPLARKTFRLSPELVEERNRLSQRIMGLKHVTA